MRSSARATAEEVPLATAVGLIARERLTGEAPPKAALAGLKLVAPWIEEKAGAELDALALTLDDQAAFAKLSRRLLEDLELASGRGPDRGPSRDEGGDDDEGDEGGDEDATEQGDEGDARPAATSRCAARRPRTARREERRLGRDGSSARTRRGRATTSATAHSPSPGRRNWDLAPETDYKAFTTRFDEIVEAERAVRRGGARAAPRLSRPADGRPAECRHQARQPAAAAADGAAGAQLGFRPGGRAARRRPARPGGRQPGPFAVATRSSATPNSATPSCRC